MSTGTSTAPLGTLEPGTISPRRPVPASIARPEYVDRPAPAQYTGSHVIDPEGVERIRRASQLAAQAWPWSASTSCRGA